MTDIFLSYSRKDTAIMQQVKQSFLDASLQVWTDEGITPGTHSWKRAIEDNIKGAKCLVCILSPDAAQSEWVRAELDFAEMHSKPTYLILARGTQTESVPFGYATHQWIDIRDQSQYTNSILQLIRQISTHQANTYNVSNLLPPFPTPAIPTFLPTPFEWVLIPSGSITVQSDEIKPSGFRVFNIKPFFIAKYPITNAQYELFVNEVGGTPSLWRREKYSQANQPVMGLSWIRAMLFCDWFSQKCGYRVILPTELQWQRAAQGNDGRLYPWGNIFDSTKANTGENNLKQPTDVTTYLDGASPFGVMDMCGNVWEWCLNVWELGDVLMPDDSTKNRILRGGSWHSRRNKINTVTRHITTQDNKAGYYGFRLVCPFLV